MFKIRPNIYDHFNYSHEIIEDGKVYGLIFPCRLMENNYINFEVYHNFVATYFVSFSDILKFYGIELNNFENEIKKD